MYLVDTNVLSELPRPRPNAAVLRWLHQQPTIVLSVVSVEELAFGVARAPVPRRAKLAAWLDELLGSAAEILGVTEAVARAAGELRAARESAGRRVAQADMLIAATAVIHGLTLATRNGRDFVGCGVALVDPFEG
jgi:predicted nucleic acid-binding protein